MKYSQLDNNNVYMGKVDGIPGDIPGSWYAPNNMCVEEDPPTDEPGKWKYLDGGWKEYTAEDAKQVRMAEIKSRLLEIDLESVRPLRAKVSGAATPEDDAKLAALEQEAGALRAELAGLNE